MPRLIDADALFESIRFDREAAKVYPQEMCELFGRFCDYAEALVKEAPTIDAEPVRRGEWEDMSTIIDSVQALYEMGKISSPTLNAASKFCQRSNVGEYACQVQTRYGWCCDLCLEDELLALYAKGVHTINSCCGHGNDALRAILVIGEESCMMMHDMGYEFLQALGHGATMWRPKSKTIADVVTAKMDLEVQDEG